MSDAMAAALLVERIRPILANQSPEMQSAALANCLAIFLAGRQVPGDPEATRKFRVELLAHHLMAAWDLIAINARIMGTTP
jgi:hypothetical protein